MRQLLLGLICGGALLLAAPAARADEYEDHVTRAMSLARGDQHREALREWEAAYALRQAPRLLYEMGCAQQSLGLTSEAMTSFSRFLTADRGEDERARVDAQSRLSRLRLLAEPRGAAAPQQPLPLGDDLRLVPVRYERRPNKGLLNAGITLLSIGYGGAFVTGVSIAAAAGSGGSSSDRSFSNASAMLVIPIVGPLISSIYLPSASSRDGSTYALVWSLPWMLTSAPLQVAGLVMTVIGAKDTRMRPVLPELSQRLQLSPYSVPGGGGLMAMGRF